MLHNQNVLSAKIRSRLVLVFALSETAAKEHLRKLCWENFIAHNGNTLAKRFGEKKRVDKEMEAGDIVLQGHCELKNSQKL